MARLVGLLTYAMAVFAVLAAVFCALAVGIACEPWAGCVVACGECMAFALACVAMIRRVRARVHDVDGS